MGACRLLIDLVVGARPNLVKAAAILEAAKLYSEVQINVVHTGQHMKDLSDPFFSELDIPVPEPNRRLICQDFTNTVARLSRMTEWLSEAFLEDRPDFVMVVGDTDSTLAGAIAAAKMKIPLVHVEAGLRSYDTNMQEEINRVMVDSVSNRCYTTTACARDQLVSEGHDSSSVKFVGNVMVDTLYRYIKYARLLYPRSERYAVLTLHRAENVDDPQRFEEILAAVQYIAKDIRIVWPTHPRLKIAPRIRENIEILSPLSYLPFISLIDGADFVMTDSGGVQEETSALGVPCLTLRNNTERPETVFEGTNMIAGTTMSEILSCYDLLGQTRDYIKKNSRQIERWDGFAAGRIFADLVGGTKN